MFALTNTAPLADWHTLGINDRSTVDHKSQLFNANGAELDHKDTGLMSG